MPIIHEPFHFEAAQNPEILQALGNDEFSGGEAPEDPAEEVILEQNGIHYVNRRVLSPDQNTEKALDPQFLGLVESLINPANPGAPGSFH
jgi:hypothetical protein